MGKQRKSGGKNHRLEKLVLTTAILNLVRALIDLIRQLNE